MTPDDAILRLSDAEIRVLAILPRGAQDDYLREAAKRDGAE